MTASTIQDILEALDARLATVPGLRHNAYMADAINPPHAVVGVPAIESYRATMQRGRIRYPLQIWVMVSANLDRVGQHHLASYADVSGDNSIPLAIEGDRTLGGTVEDCVVQSFRPLGMDEVGQLGFYGGVFDVLAIALGR